MTCKAPFLIFFKRGCIYSERATPVRQVKDAEDWPAMTEDYRSEKDSMGELKVPADALDGAQTQRVIDNFPVCGVPMPAALIRAIALIKRCAARVNGELGLLLAQGGTAVGTGINAHPRFASRMVECLADATGLPFAVTPSFFEALSSQDAAVELPVN